MDKTKMDNLLEIAKVIINSNPGIYLSGSIALMAMGYKVRREPKDIDFYLPIDKQLILLEG